VSLGTFLNGGTASHLRGLLWLSLSDTGQVGAKTSASDSGGGATESWSFGSSVPCRVDPIQRANSEVVIAERLSDRSTHLITTPPGTSVGLANRFLVANRGTFEVTAVRVRTASPAQFFEAVQVS
jgi:hypothetical protein